MQQPINPPGLGHGLGDALAGPGQTLVGRRNLSVRLFGRPCPGRRLRWLLWHLASSAASRITPAARLGKQVCSGGVPVDGACWEVMDQPDELDLAIQRVQEALDRVRAAWQAEHPDRPGPVPELSPPAWHPDPHQAPVTTRQWAEVTRMRAESLRQQRRQVHEQALQLHQATQELLRFLQRPPVDDDPANFTRVSPAILLPRPPRHR
jgi:hypothetical protein